MTERLYYRDPSILEFKGTITDAGQRDRVFYTVLDRSAFYPTSGGQLHDVGTLAGHRVIDVIESEREGESVVEHITTEQVGEVGQSVVGMVDASRRHDNQHKHTAQHIISHVFSDMAAMATTSVHLGIDYGAVELDTDAVEQSLLDSAEQRANEVVRECHPIDIMFVDAQQARKLPLRRRPPERDMLRVIRIGELDWSACGGTHCTNTGEVGLIKFIGRETLRGHALIKFLAGRQALDDYARRWQITSDVATELTCHFEDLPERIAGLQREIESYRHQLRQIQKELLPVRAGQLGGQAREIAGVRVAVSIDADLDPKAAIQLVRFAADQSKVIALVLAGDRLLIAAPEGSPVRAGVLARKLCELTGGRGGGSDTQAQVGQVKLASGQALGHLVAKAIDEV